MVWIIFSSSVLCLSLRLCHHFCLLHRLWGWLVRLSVCLSVCMSVFVSVSVYGLNHISVFSSSVLWLSLRLCYHFCLLRRLWCWLVCLSVRLSVCLSLSLFLSMIRIIYPSFHLACSLFLSDYAITSACLLRWFWSWLACLFVRLSVWCLSVSLSVFISVSGYGLKYTYICLLISRALFPSDYAITSAYYVDYEADLSVCLSVFVSVSVYGLNYISVFSSRWLCLSLRLCYHFCLLRRFWGWLVCLSVCLSAFVSVSVYGFSYMSVFHLFFSDYAITSQSSAYFVDFDADL